MNTKIGSTWGKWDLHIHTHHSHLANQYNCTAKEIAAKIKGEDLKVVGITNYFIVLEEEIAELNKELNGTVALLPNFEFRINDKNQRGEYINVHIIFNLKSHNVTFNKIYASLARVPIDNISAENKKYCTLEDIKEFGFDKVTVNFDTLKNQLIADFVIEDDFLIIGVNSGYGGFHPDNKPRNIFTAIKMDKTSHFIFGNEGDTNFFLNNPERLAHGLPQKSVIKCSDAHTIKDIGTKFTWIKSNPTFNGLKQVMYEPEERVKIQSSNPQCDFAKPYFSNIDISENFQSFSVKLSHLKNKVFPLILI
jgi:exonuclease SbcC